MPELLEIAKGANASFWLIFGVFFIVAAYFILHIPRRRLIEFFEEKSGATNKLSSTRLKGFGAGVVAMCLIMLDAASSTFTADVAMVGMLLAYGAANGASTAWKSVKIGQPPEREQVS